MIQTAIVQKKTPEQTMFSETEWRHVDKEHYGADAGWVESDFVVEAKDGDEIIGILEASVLNGVARIGNVIVSRAHSRKSVGRQLMGMFEDEAKRQGAHKIYLITGKGWAAESFYVSLGYVKEGDLPNHFRHQDFVAYSKFILEG